MTKYEKQSVKMVEDMLREVFEARVGKLKFPKAKSLLKAIKRMSCTCSTNHNSAVPLEIISDGEYDAYWYW